MGECRYHDMVDERFPLRRVDNPTRFRRAEIEGLRDDRLLAWQTGEGLSDSTTCENNQRGRGEETRFHSLTKKNGMRMGNL